MVAHVHGLEVRPSFDGNPLAWLGKNGKVGMGFTTLSNSKYYGLFRDPMSTSLLLDPSISYLYVKVNRYDNFQAPGNLWYHDHSMHATRANVALGMAGDYIIHDPEIDRQLPQGEYEILIVAG
jgi:spore coat protein A